MKIAYITMQFPVPSEAFASLDVNTLRTMGHEVSCYGLRPRHRDYVGLVKERGHESMTLHHFSFLNFVKAVLFGIFNPGLVCKLVAWIAKNSKTDKRHMVKGICLIPSSLYIFAAIKKNPPDVVHLFWGHYPSIVGYLVLEYMPAVVMSVFLGAYDLNRDFCGSIFVADRADCVFTHASENIGLLNKMNLQCQKINVVYRGTLVDNSIIPQKDKFSQMEAPIFLTASRLIKVKRVDRVLELYAAVCKAACQAKLFIVGEGPERQRLEKMADILRISDRVEFCGHIAHRDLLKLMSTAHFFLLMSESESERLPNVVKEAMYQQCICITTNTLGINELIDHGKDGFVVDKGDTQTAVNIMRNLLSDPDRCKTVSQRTRQTIIDNFDVHKSMQKYVDVWQKAMIQKKKLN